ncbi:aspartyl-phosphate phosphatase Spo0E family protein [Paenibacillus xerothermodurans]|uniref:Aspartyl-phosphate phosphatase Spo0E family protein n=1 Tax=Paenibacillus xerothermodurans TaxID=1977292 RepID=A0A2W1NQK9_PAEXE|nr:aspartyl-phosphate phosphatase Spo0E family protein [Paenibacillus xerothermodurans]PZE21765.1 aspartyl-phosphate phosphatase Spo0E family protein [Paenibacillus xerothermodurans]
MKDTELKLHMERMQDRLYRLVEQTGSFVNPQVIQLSQEIDDVIIAMQRLMMKQSEDKSV